MKLKTTLKLRDVCESINFALDELQVNISDKTLITTFIQSLI